MEIIWHSGALIFSVICLCLHGAWGCAGSHPNYGNMTRDQQLLVGSTLTIKCTVFPITNASSSDLVIKFKNSLLNDLIVLDSQSVAYIKENASVKDTGLYNCFINKPSEANIFVCATEVSVGFKPLPVTNFSCISKYYRYLNCSWEKPFNPVKTRYKLLDGFKRDCAEPNETFCIWSSTSSPVYRKAAKRLSFTLIGSNPLGRSEEYFSINHFEIVQPDHPQKIVFYNVTKTSVRVIWQRPSGMEYNDFPPGLDYWLYYCPASGEHPELCGVVNTTKELSCYLTDLVPYVEYRVSIRCRSTVTTSDELWSTFENATFQTEPDVPGSPPELSISSFEILGSGHIRNVVLYWKPILNKFEHGKDFQYRIHYHTHYRHSRNKRETAVINVGNSTTFSFRLNVETAYLFKISSINHVGESVNSSVIIVDKLDNLLKGPTDIAAVSFGHGKYFISWKSHLTDANYTLFWCRDLRPRPFKCAGVIDWIDTNQTSYELTLADNSSNYQFAVATVLNGLTSGMIWARCVVPNGGVLNGISDIVLTPKNATSMRVRWILDCVAQKSVIREYKIIYCHVDHNKSCIGEKKSIFLNNSQSEQVIVGGLKPYSQYKFSVQAGTADGWSEDSYYKFENTPSAAPDDPPRNAKAMVVNDTIVKVFFQPPLIPNGNISHYNIYYSTSTTDKRKISYPVTQMAEFYEAELRMLNFYTNYFIEIEACVQLLCSNHSKPEYIFTGIGAPGSVNPPHMQIINSSLVNVTWKPPQFPNGPIDMYLLSVVWEDDEDFQDNIERQVYNITNTYVTISVDCPDQLFDGRDYYFSVQAVNIKNGKLLTGPPSERTETRLCYIGTKDLDQKLIMGGIIGGAACGLILVVLIIYFLAKWMKKKVDMVKSITVQLPTGLDSPIENPLNSYDKFKSGLQTNRDSGIPSDRNYERLCSYASDKSSKEFENFYEASSEEFLNSKTGREKSGRNQSGDSNASGKCHDSISSTNTNKTHLSIDSGADVELPQSPDGHFSDTSSSNTTPRSYKPDLEIVEESQVSSSKDSGLDKEGLNRSSPNIQSKIELANVLPCYIKKKNQTYFNVQMLKNPGQIQPYSKFAIIAPAFAPKYVTYGVHSLMDHQSLANSEPSVPEAQDEANDSEPLVLSGVPPYCRFGLARSAGTGINIVNQATMPEPPNLGYSKFGIIYNMNANMKATPSEISNYTKVACPTILQNPFAQKFLPDSLLCKNFESTDTKKAVPVNKGYVSFNHALNAPAPSLKAQEEPVVLPNLEENSISDAESDISDAVIENLVPKPQIKGYVSFQDAKIMSQPLSFNPVQEIISPISVFSDSPDEDDVASFTLTNGETYCNGDSEVDFIPNHQETSESPASNVSKKTQSNGYVPWTELLDTDKSTSQSAPSNDVVNV